MEKYELTEGEACLLVAVFEHLKPYYEQAKANGTSVADEMKNDDVQLLGAYFEQLAKVLTSCLNEREYKIITQRFGLFPYARCRTLEEIGREFGVTRERIRQVEAKALRKIKQHMTELDDEETYTVVCGLQADVQEHLLDATRAYVAGDSVSEEVYDHYWTVGTNAINKLRIQQAMRKYREGTE